MSGHVGTLFGSVGPVLDAHLLVEEPVRPASDVAGGEHTGHRRAGHVERVEVGIAHDAVAEPQATAFEPLGVRGDADADDDDVGGHDLASDEPYPFGCQPLDEDPAADVDAVGAVQIGDRLAHLGAEPTDQRSGGPFEHDDVVAERLRRSPRPRVR